MSIPKIIHQLWIGPKPAPTKFMNTWKDKNPDFEYIFWNEAELVKRQMNLVCTDKIESIEEINGKADIIRWEILAKYGGIFQDADSICIEPIDDILMNTKGFAGYENEQARPGLVATGTMGFPPNHPLCKAAVAWILKNEVSQRATKKMAWQTVGPVLLTALLKTGLYTDITIFPSYFFLPVHCTGVTYTAHSKIYAYQEWGSTKKNYDIMNSIELPSIFQEPTEWVSVLVSSYNTKYVFVQECLDSIREQQGHFGMELVWVNDGSDDLSTKLLEKALEQFRQRSRFCRIVYKKMENNMGVPYCLNQGTLLCTNELVVRHDSDDIMLPHRIQTQLQFMRSHPDCVLLGSNVVLFTIEGKEKKQLNQTCHPAELTWEQYKQSKSHWIMNHPSIMYKRSAVLDVGNYTLERGISEDFELELKILKKYGKIYNIQESLVLYRIHPDQVTYNGKSSTSDNVMRRNAFIESLIKSP